MIELQTRLRLPSGTGEIAEFAPIRIWCGWHESVRMEEKLWILMGELSTQESVNCTGPSSWLIRAASTMVRKEGLHPGTMAEPCERYYVLGLILVETIAFLRPLTEHGDVLQTWRFDTEKSIPTLAQHFKRTNNSRLMKPFLSIFYSWMFKCSISILRTCCCAASEGLRMHLS